ncbi:hypothetical protein [Chloroflexus sp.]|uniref:hypothetical protein n=1 Tax=Chloroflexus sp. TaxID=1904827 RepID=UPI00298F3987|nr:hypothetical protein [Chloroflexus sp.]MCS6887446.1 hypothetical protein [Chloroflexus sp.]MDW8404143.1 hypothetical protein [Chloroflexus sp.]
MSPFLGVNVSMASVEELRQRELLEEGETLLALFDGTLLDENRRRVGGLALADFVALTDRRLILWARGFFNDIVDGFPWSDVDVVRAETWDPWHGRVSLALRIPATPPRKRRVALGEVQDPGQPERVIVNTLDYMPAEDVDVLAKMVAWVGDQVLAGVTGEELVKAFEAEFPAVERKPLPPFFVTEPAPPPMPEPEPKKPAKKPWWKFGAADEEEPAPASPGNLIAAYERQRGGAPSGAAPAPVGPLPTLPEQPNMYEVSRSLRLMLEVPRGLARGLRRASEIVSGATELLNNMQDPQVRRNAMRGLYYAAAQQEAEGGPLAPVGPVVRAAVRFAEPVEQQQASNEPVQRRIAVRATVRQATPAASEPAPAAAPPAEPAAPQPVRRAISVRRVEPPAEENGSSMPVRRVVVNRTTAVNGSGSGAGAPAREPLNGRSDDEPEAQ